MISVLWIFFLLPVIHSEQQDTKIENFQSHSANETVLSKNESVSNNNQTLMMDMQRITQPMEVAERSLERNFSMPENKTENKHRLGDFKPSPHLGSYYEHNAHPVKPAFPEAKTFDSYLPESQNVVWPDRHYNVPAWTEKQSIQNPYDYNIWTENPKENQRVQQITTPPPPPWRNDQGNFPNAAQVPYQFDHNRNFPVTTEGFAFNKPVQAPQMYPPKPAPSFWDRLLGFGGDKPREKPISQQKTFIDYNLLEAPPQQGGSFYEFQSPKGHEYGGLGHLESYGGYGMNPWKKIIKALAAIIPIGLFISALTPTVITVSTTNGTSQSRYRLEDSPQEDITKRLSTSLSYFRRLNEDGCENRVLCELLVSASFSKNAERHIRNLLDNFVNQEHIENKKEDLLKIFEAVKNQDCSPILCGNLKNPT